MAMDQAELMRQVRLIQADESLTDGEKAHKRQKLLCGGWAQRMPAADSGARCCKTAGAHLRL